MLTRFTAWQGREPESVAADTTYGNGEFLQWLADRNITPYMRTRDSIHRKRSSFFGSRKKCGPCSLRPQCTRAAFRGLIIHQNEPARQRARDLVNTPAFAQAQRQRKKVEALFAELKNQIGLRRLRLTTDEVRSRAVLPRGGCAEYQAPGALPHRTIRTTAG